MPAIPKTCTYSSAHRFSKELLAFTSNFPVNIVPSGKEPQMVGNTHETLSEIQFPSMTVIGDSVTFLGLRFLTNKHVVVELQVLLLSAVAMFCGHYLLLTLA